MTLSVLNMIGRWVAAGVDLSDTPVLQRLVFDWFGSLPQRVMLGVDESHTFNTDWMNDRVLASPNRQRQFDVSYGLSNAHVELVRNVEEVMALGEQLGVSLAQVADVISKHRLRARSTWSALDWDRVRDDISALAHVRPAADVAAWVDAALWDAAIDDASALAAVRERRRKDV